MSSLEPEISIDYTLSYREYVAASKFARRSNPLHAAFLYLVLYGGIATFVFFLLVSYFAYKGQGLHGLIAIAPVLILTALVPLSMTYTWRVGYNRLLSSGSSSAELHFEADACEFRRRVNGMGVLTWNWSATQGFATNKSWVVIAARKGAYILIPRRALTDAQVARLKQMQEEKQSC